ncbi:hypothetical protein [Actinomadura alba]|uniref:Uncharacterized protein n=1 Tax=Actinomadura alba TaxID=406431 RepID=A0ABR7M0H7_9ACTN|nr:hypothetical protein [Actinomadura alba]MBC6470128.1 hypothetical protein [Actinomadura alba]
MFGASVWAWCDAVRLVGSGHTDTAFAELAGQMPAAAHAVLNPDGTAIPSASGLLERFRQALVTRSELKSAAVQQDGSGTLRAPAAPRSGRAQREYEPGEWGAVWVRHGLR